jgi:hypothetical protein
MGKRNKQTTIDSASQTSAANSERGKDEAVSGLSHVDHKNTKSQHNAKYEKATHADCSSEISPGDASRTTEAGRPYAEPSKPQIAGPHEPESSSTVEFQENRQERMRQLATVFIELFKVSSWQHSNEPRQTRE